MDSMDEQLSPFEEGNLERDDVLRWDSGEEDGDEITNIPLPFTEEPSTDEPSTDNPSTDDPFFTDEALSPEEPKEGEMRAFESWGAVRMSPEDMAALESRDGLESDRDFKNITNP